MSRFNIPAVSGVQQQAEVQENDHQQSFDALCSLQEMKLRLDLLLSYGVDATAKELEECSLLKEKVSDISSKISAYQLWERSGDSVPTVELASGVNSERDGIKFFHNGFALLRKFSSVHPDYGDDNISYRLLAPHEARELVQISLKNDEEEARTIALRLATTRQVMGDIPEVSDIAPKNFLRDPYYIRSQERAESEQRIDKMWSQLVMDSEVPDAYSHDDLENILYTALAERTQDGKPTKDVNDLLFTVRNLLQEDNRIRALGMLRIAFHDYIEKHVPKKPFEEGDDVELYSAFAIAETIFQGFERSMFRYITNGEFMDDDRHDTGIRKYLEQYVRAGSFSDETDTPRKRLWKNIILFGIHALEFFGISSQELLQNRIVSQEERNHLFAIDISGISDNELADAIQKAPCVIPDHDRVVGYVGEKRSLSLICNNTPRPTTFPDLNAVKRAIVASGHGGPEIFEARTFVEVIVKVPGMLVYDAEYENEDLPIWRYGYRDHNNEWEFAAV